MQSSLLSYQKLNLWTTKGLCRNVAENCATQSQPGIYSWKAKRINHLRFVQVNLS